MPKYITRRYKTKDKLTADSVNEIIEMVNSLRPIDSATVKHSWTTQGVISQASGGKGGGGTATKVAPYSFQLGEETPKKPKENTLYVSYYEGELYAIPWNKYHRPQADEEVPVEERSVYGYLEIPNDTDYSVYYVVCKYDFGDADLEGTWSNIELVDSSKFTTDKEWQETNDNYAWIRRVFIIGQVILSEKDRDGIRTIDTIIQKWLQGDVWMYDLARCV